MSTTATVILDGQEYEIEVKDGQTVLEAAIEAEIDPPFSCRAAACCSCMALLMEGEVKMDSDDPLSEEEKDEGFILTCQSHPLTDKIKISYDEAW
ncbi:MAG: 2Fe-2S iron-sulfur cluster binding domain-containing protein [Chitinophagales bacterium]|nr:2Fe-2S iron-sulfur cluster binding domain-containing protein [Chitinophagales bacterium]